VPRKVSFEVESDNWTTHTNDKGLQVIGFQPTSTGIFGSNDRVVLSFGDDIIGAGVMLVMTRKMWNEYLLTIAKARENIEARDEQKGD
jgi:hypothetical protein